MNTTEIPDMLQTLQNIELLAFSGAIPGVLTALTARLLATELAHSNNESETLERAARFVVECKQMTVAKV